MIAGSFSSDLVFILHEKSARKEQDPSNVELALFLLYRIIFILNRVKNGKKDRLPIVVDGLFDYSPVLQCYSFIFA
ncbi:MAG: hypothetical protein IIU73_04865, partial [Selenomonadales bacterium]|nr:hypothetical protein [Selenomonadales bacterium]